MKLLSLNIWGGRVHQPLIELIKKYNNEIDVFCFQEFFDSPTGKFANNGIKTDIYTEVSKILKDYVGFFAPTFTGYDTDEKVDYSLSFGQATFVKKSLDLVSEETVFVYGKYDHAPTVHIEGIKDGLDLPRNIHLVKLRSNNKDVLIGNLHGYWIPGKKIDTPQSIVQMQKVKEIIAGFKGPKILCGDFNLRPDTKSIKMLEEEMKNLIIQYKITNTRSNLHARTEKFADYILISNQIKVHDFKVINEDVSDHLPLYLDFTV
jgi:exonuclease III